MTLPPIRRHLVVRATPERAYRVFTEQLGAWWPLVRHSVYETGNTVAFEGDAIVERSASGESTVWGRVTLAEPPHRIAFTWHPGREEDRGEVEVTFVPVGEAQTLVTLVHSGWESYGGAAAEAREEYRNGWPTVLGAFASEAGADADAVPEGELWFVLSHTAGPAAGVDGVFAHPLFAEHGAFLASLAADGVLVGAGPLPDEADAGQTIVRVPAECAAELLARAEADASVAGELLELRIRTWNVLLP
ncbi:SRPBCC domain-containing protein [Protaetiibacter intestinalis]|uniref:Activator of Hsp90 ATPase homologue 1/2-like C-terminal domain-containing protein n=1 Tax=Protaetiibacter intestinalis TaxID=2419774 RepID=A0A387B3V9_9MICO|nr:SRPBCC domain-containing protein [Protaetiibacter intestinalis]AYF98314.1 hypothetical protein D7I47_08625 [Protaetiibacter intestinalis]